MKEIAQALSKAQAEIPPVKFDAVNPFLKNKYASLGACIETARPALLKHGLAVVYLPTTTDNGLTLKQVIMHSSGEQLESEMSLPIGEERGKSLAQVAGSLITYMRRYMFTAALNMYADEDGDGGGQNEKPAPKKAEPVREVAPAPVRQTVTYIEPMDLAEAKQVQNSKGEYYWNLPSDTLSHMANAMAKSLRKPDITPEREEELIKKQAAAVAIMQYRNEAQPEGGAE